MAVNVGIVVEPGTCVLLAVTVAAGLDVAVRVGGIYTTVFVGLFATMAVFVASEMFVGPGDAKRV